MHPISVTLAHRTALSVIVLMLIPALGAGDSVWIKRAGYEQLRQGVASDGGQNLYVSRKGRIQTINRQDFNLDGELDLLFTQDHNDVYAPDSLIYWGGPAGFHSLLPEMWQMRAPFSVLTWLDRGKSRMTRLPTMGGGRSKIADLNLDGHLDLVFANFMHNYRSDQQSLIYWGSDSGFSPSNRMELPTFLASGVAVGDLNGDGLPEVILSNRGDERGETWGYRLHLESYIYWGSADGYSPTRRTSIPSISAADVASADFNGDGSLDLAVVNLNREEQSAFIYYNDGTGGFELEKRQHLTRDHLRLEESSGGHFGSYQGMQTLLATDLNDDHFSDLVIGGTHKSVVYYGTRTGLDVEKVFELPAENCKGIAAADLNRDGIPEIILANEGRRPADPAQGAAQSTIYWSAAAGFDPANRTHLPTLGATTVQVAELNGDEFPDILFGNSHDHRFNDVPSYIYWGDSNGYSSHRRKELTGFGTIGSGVADLNRDGWPDILLVSHVSGKRGVLPPVVFWGNTAHHYSSASSTLLDLHPHMEFSVADMDDDGFPDIVFLGDRPRSQQAIVVWGSADGFDPENRTQLPVSGAQSNNVADLNRDGYLDILFTAPSKRHKGRQRNPSGVVVWGNGDRLKNAQTSQWELSSTGTESNAIADLNKDGYLDLIFPLHHANQSEIWYGNSRGYQRPNSRLLRANGAPHAVVADLDRDSWLDLIFTNSVDPERFTVNTATLIHWGGPDGFSTSTPTELEGYTSLDTTVADFNRDGHLDIAMTNYRSDTNRKHPTFIYWGDGSRGYSEKRRQLLKTASGAGVDALDLNRDGWLELIISNHQENFDHGAAGTDILWGGPKGYSRSRRTNLPTVGVHLDSMVDSGNVYDRGYRWEYEFDPVEAPRNTSFKRLHWTGKASLGTGLEFQIRSAVEKKALGKAPWRGPSGPESFFTESPAALSGAVDDHDWLQYRVYFISADGGNTAYLNEVSIECE